MRTQVMAVALVTAVGAVLTSVGADKGDDRDQRLRTSLSGFNEVHFVAGPPAALRGAVSTAGKGRFTATIDDANQTIQYELSYRDLEGIVTQAHIHFGQAHTTGGIVLWLCQTNSSPAPPAVSGLTPLCPEPNGGTVTGTLTTTHVLAQAAQGIEAGAFREVAAAIRAGAAYVNVHSSLFPPGEIRGQLGDDHDDDDHDHD